MGINIYCAGIGKLFFFFYLSKNTEYVRCGTLGKFWKGSRKESWVCLCFCLGVGAGLGSTSPGRVANISGHVRKRRMGRQRGAGGETWMPCLGCVHGAFRGWAPEPQGFCCAKWSLHFHKKIWMACTKQRVPFSVLPQCSEHSDPLLNQFWTNHVKKQRKCPVCLPLYPDPAQHTHDLCMCNFEFWCNCVACAIIQMGMHA